MNLALHQFKTEIRTFRILWLLWFVLLALDCVVKQSGLALRDYSDQRDMMLRLSNTVNWTVFMFIPTLVMLGASPSRQDSFWSTRPMPKRDLYLGKILFVFVFILLAAIVQEGAWLASKGLPSGVIFRGMYERLLFALPLVAGIMAFAALCKNVGEAIVGIFVIGGSVLFGSLLVINCVNYFTRTLFIEESVSLYLTVFWLYSLALIVTAVLNAHWHWSVPVKWGLCIAAGFAVILGFGHNVKKNEIIDSMDPKLAAEISQMPVSVVPFIETHQDHKQMEAVKCDVVANIPDLPKDCTIEWNGDFTTLKFASGKSIEFYNSSYKSRFLVPSQPAPVSGNAIPLSRLMGTNVLFMGSCDNWDSSKCQLFSSVVAQGRLSQKMMLEGDLRGDIFRWKKVGLLPLKTGAITNDDGFQIKVESATNFTTSANLGRVVIQLKVMGPSLRTTSEWRYLSYPDWPNRQYAFLIFNSKKAMAVAADGTSKAESIVMPSAFEERLLTLPFGLQMEPQKFIKDFKAGEYFLMILKCEYLGQFKHHWKLADFTLPKGTLQVVNGGNTAMEEKAYEKKLLAMKDPGDSRVEAGHYLSEILCYLESYGDLTDAERMAWLPKLEKLMPRQLPLLLDALSMSEKTTKLLLNCISKGAMENQKGEIIEAFRQNPRLAAVIAERGWNEAAMPVYKYYLDSPVPLASELFVGLRDAHQSLPRLLHEIEFSQAWGDILEMDNIANSLPDAQKQLDPLVGRMWKKRKADFYVSGHDGPDVALQMQFSKEMLLSIQHGNREAFMRAWQIIELINPAWVTADCGGLGRVVVVGLANGSLVEKLAKHKPEDFVYAPDERCFVLKQNPETTK